MTDNADRNYDPLAELEATAWRKRQELDRLKAVNAKLVKALEPFAAIDAVLTNTERRKPADTPIYGYCGWELRLEMVRDAVLALKEARGHD